MLMTPLVIRGADLAPAKTSRLQELAVRSALATAGKPARGLVPTLLPTVVEDAGRRVARSGTGAPNKESLVFGAGGGLQRRRSDVHYRFILVGDRRGELLVARCLSRLRAVRRSGSCGGRGGSMLGGSMWLASESDGGQDEPTDRPGGEHEEVAGGEQRRAGGVLERGGRGVGEGLGRKVGRQGVQPVRLAAWEARARAELRASGEAARRRDPSTRDQLTPRNFRSLALSQPAKPTQKWRRSCS